MALQSIQPSDRATIDALLQAFEQDLSSSVRQAASQGLAANSQGERYVIDILFGSLTNNEDDKLVRSLAAFSIGEIAAMHPDAITDSDIQVLLKIIQNDQEERRVIGNSIRAIAQSNAVDENTDDVLIKALQYQDEYVSQQAAIALSAIVEQFYDQSNTLDQIADQKGKIIQIQDALTTLAGVDDPDIKEARQRVETTLENLGLKRRTLILETTQRWLIGNRAIWILHPLVWLGLVWAYPKSRQIQAFFFWNKHIRAVLGCWYVGPVITAIPFLRRRLFAPFKESLLADAKLDIFDPQAYFPDSEVQLKGTHQTQPLAKALPEIKGEIILEGESGLGKTMLLRHLVKQTKRVTVYLPAYKCEKGVIEAIQAKLHGQAQDAEFLRHLSYSGALDICIDGLNEVGADVRANITAFVESYFKGNILITTQPLLWNPPSTAKTYVLQPLPRSRIDRFLSLQQQRLSTNQAQSPEYEAACATFLETALDEQQPAEDLALAQRILSNPVDLSVAAQIIHAGLNPDLFQLQQQQYTLMAKDYEQSWNQKFPLNAFSDYVYEMRVNDQQGMTGDVFYQALSIMEQEQHRMVLSRQWQDLSGAAHKEWSFRHDKIMEFFLVQPFLALDAKGLEKRKQHLGDSRFRGIYLMLARLLPLEAALALREALIQHAADTKDHTVSDDYVQIMRSRTTETSSLDLA